VINLSKIRVGPTLLQPSRLDFHGVVTAGKCVVVYFDEKPFIPHCSEIHSVNTVQSRERSNPLNINQTLSVEKQSAKFLI
jgi:hypothetical protein